MVAQFCTLQLERYKILVQHYGTFMVIFCVLMLTFSVVATLANLLVIRALWKTSSIPATLKKLFLSLAFSDLAMGILAQPMVGIMVAVMLKMAAASGNFDFFCPTILTISYFTLFLLASASFLNITAIAVDRLLAISLHLRYQELVTPKRIVIALLSVWLTSFLAASVYILLPNNHDRVSDALEFVGILVTTVAYIRIYKIVRYHQNQIQSQCQVQNGQAMEVLREKKSAINALYVYVVFLACYVPYLCCTILLIVESLRPSYLVGHQASLFLIVLNSSLNPLVYCWRYREIREIVKSTAKKILRFTET